MRIVSDDGKVSSKIDEFPSCDNIAIFHSTYLIGSAEAGQGVGTKAHAERLAIAKKLGYGMVLCTVQDTNLAQIRILQKFDWYKLVSFKSNKTGNTVCVYCKEL